MGYPHSPMGAHGNMGDRAKGPRPSYPPRLFVLLYPCSAEHGPRAQRQRLVILPRTHCVTSARVTAPRPRVPMCERRAGISNTHQLQTSNPGMSAWRSGARNPQDNLGQITSLQT